MYSHLFLIQTLVVILCAPLFVSVLLTRPKLHRAVDLITRLSVVYVLLAHLLIPSVRYIGWSCLIVFLAGCLASIILKKLNSKLLVASQFLGFIGLFFHSVTDGVILSLPNFSGENGFGTYEAMALSIVLHTFFLSFFVWEWSRFHFGKWFGYLWLVAVAACTMVGYFLPYQINLHLIESEVLTQTQCLLAGMLTTAIVSRCYHDASAGVSSLLSIKRTTDTHHGHSHT